MIINFTDFIKKIEKVEKKLILEIEKKPYLGEENLYLKSIKGELWKFIEYYNFNKIDYKKTKDLDLINEHNKHNLINEHNKYNLINDYNNLNNKLYLIIKLYIDKRLYLINKLYIDKSIVEDKELEERLNTIVIKKNEIKASIERLEDTINEKKALIKRLEDTIKDKLCIITRLWNKLNRLKDNFCTNRLKDNFYINKEKMIILINIFPTKEEMEILIGKDWMKKGILIRDIFKKKEKENIKKNNKNEYTEKKTLKNKTCIKKEIKKIVKVLESKSFSSLDYTGFTKKLKVFEQNINYESILIESIYGSYRIDHPNFPLRIK